MIIFQIYHSFHDEVSIIVTIKTEYFTVYLYCVAGKALSTALVEV